MREKHGNYEIKSPTVVHSKIRLLGLNYKRKEKNLVPRVVRTNRGTQTILRDEVRTMSKGRSLVKGG